MEGIQAREIECDRVCEGWRDAGCRRWTDESRGFGKNRGDEGAIVAGRRGGSFRRLLPLSRRSGRSRQSRRDGGNPARRFGARRGCHSRRRSAWVSHGVYRHAALPTLSFRDRCVVPNSEFALKPTFSAQFENVFPLSCILCVGAPKLWKRFVFGF